MYNVDFMLCLSLRFYVKSILENQEVQKTAFFQFYRIWNLLIWYISAFQNYKKLKKINIQRLECVKMADLALQESPKSMSRKVLVIAKLWNFYTVYHVHWFALYFFFLIFFFCANLSVESAIFLKKLQAEKGPKLSKMMEREILIAVARKIGSNFDTI